ncbi:MAG: hypothetical protein NTV67_05670 [Chloroflexi bacterium]|nr:hypothetical protein [Chloroflexota bacterium]
MSSKGGKVMQKKGADLSASVASVAIVDGADAHQQLFASRIRAGLFALFTLLSVWITTSSAGVQGNFSFWADKIGGTNVEFSVPVNLLWGVAVRQRRRIQVATRHRPHLAAPRLRPARAAA